MTTYLDGQAVAKTASASERAAATRATAPTSVRNEVTGPARVSVVIPARNEARNLPHVFAQLPAGLHEVILVDGNSSDDTIAVARQLRSDVIVVEQTRKGKGNALACGFAAVTGDIVVMIDADGSTQPTEIPTFVKALIDGADVAKGSRFADGGGSEDITLLRSAGNHGLNTLANLLFRMRYTDLCYGYVAFWADVIPQLELPDIDLESPSNGSMLWGDGFEIETLIAVRSAKAKLAIAEVASVEKLRIHGESNLNTFSDGFRVLRTMLRERLTRSSAPDHVRARPHIIDVRA